MVADDDEALRTALCEGLGRAGYDVAGASSGDEALKELDRGSFALLLSDLVMPGMDGVTLVRRALQRDPRLVAILMTGRGSVDTAVEAMKVGVFDYLLKPFKLAFILPTIKRAIEARALRIENEEQTRILDLTADVGLAIVRHGPQLDMLRGCLAAIVRHLDAASACIWTLNERERMLELQASAGMDSHAGGPQARIPVGDSMIGLIAQNKQPYLTNDVANDPCAAGTEWMRREGIAACAAYPLVVGTRLVGVVALFARRPLGGGGGRGLAAVVNEIALGLRRRQAEEELRRMNEDLERLVVKRTAQFLQAQKMEAIGRLAGSVAHDFGNQLFVIDGYAEELLEQAAVAEQPALRVPVEEIRNAARRSAELTSQLLSFSRKQVLRPRLVDLKAELAAAQNMLRRLVGKDVRLSVAARGRFFRVLVDPVQFNQVLVNLAANARDAMPRGGTLALELSESVVREMDARALGEIAPGGYVVLTVSDTGHGMDKATMNRIFEPFFTTKDAGKGTGLGLATVYGIVKQSGGHLTVHSEPGRGTVFAIYLPRVEDGEPMPGGASGEETAGVTETVAAVEHGKEVSSP